MKKDNQAQMKMIIPTWRKWVSRFSKVWAVIMTFYVSYAYAAGTDNIGNIATKITGSFEGVAKLVTAGAYVAGVGFALTAILKFKAHKDNPTQIPIGTPIALLFVSAALLFLPNLFGIAGQSVFGTTSGFGGISGVTGLG